MIAKELLEIDQRQASLECELDDAVDAILGLRTSRISRDWYDSSLEIYGVGDLVLTDEQRQRIIDLGCIQFWTHPGDAKSHETERHYGREA